MAQVVVNQLTDSDNKYVFEVVVIEGATKSHHSVTMDKSFYTNLNTGSSPRQVVQKSFDFLLAREPKESILKEFDLKIISRYFPEYQSESKKF